MIWIIALGLMISIMLAVIWFRDEDEFRNSKGSNFPVVYIFYPMGIALFISFFVSIITAPHVHDYNIPDCPGGHLKHYEYPLNSFSNEEDVVDQFDSHGWSNIAVYTMEDSGFFSSPDRIVSGDCFNP